MLALLALTRLPSLSAVSMATCRLSPQRIDERERGAEEKAGRAISAAQALAEAEAARRPNTASQVEPRRGARRSDHPL